MSILGLDIKKSIKKLNRTNVSKKMLAEFSGNSPGIKNCRELLIEVLERVMSQKMARLIVDQDSKNFHIDNLNKANEYTQKIFIDNLLKERLKGFMDSSEIRQFKLVAYANIYGTEKAKNFVYEDFYVKSKVPIEFMHINFGPLMGKLLIEIGQDKFGIENIYQIEEAKQIKFMSKLFDILFKGFPKSLKSKISLSMIKFVKHGELKKDESLSSILESMDVSSSLFIQKLIDNLTQFTSVKDIDNVNTDTWVDLSSKFAKTDSEKLKMVMEVLKYKKKLENMNKDDQEYIRDQNIICDIKLILGAYMDIDYVDKVVNTSLSVLGLQRVSDTLSSPTKFIDLVIQNSIIREFSINKTSIIKDKLRRVLR